MDSTTRATLRLASALMLGLALLPLARAHGDDEGAGEHGGHHDAPAADSAAEKTDGLPRSYFGLADHANLIYAHIALMSIAWVMILPIAVMFSIARSRYTLMTQFVFLATNALAVLLGTVYNSRTEDLYPGDVHHSIGWVATWVASAHIAVNLIGWVASSVASSSTASSQLSQERQAFMPLATSDTNNLNKEYRISDDGDSASGSDTGSASLRSDSASTIAADSDSHHERQQRLKEYVGHDEEDEEDDILDDIPLDTPRPKGFLALHAAKAVSSRIWCYVRIAYNVVDRVILPLGFIAFTSGIVTYARVFEGHGIYGGLAHWVKGGVFFWLGLFTLGRWSGSFANLGWAWNVRPKESGRRKWRPSAEFVESGLIFFYGITNVFMEHLGTTDGKWTAQDLEHVSITILFIGGGLCGMLVESTRIRDLLNTTVHDIVDENAYSAEECHELEEPATYEFSINPIPALVILLLGIMMSSHHQHSAMSSMVHGQWGMLLSAASFSRGLSYVIMYLKPPKSVLPSRPPTELLAAFGLMAGGIIFMASAADIISAMEHFNLEAGFMFTVTMGFVGLLMAWTIIVLALKGLAIRKERRSTYH